jgi:hypothetical protein
MSNRFTGKTLQDAVDELLRLKQRDAANGWAAAAHGTSSDYARAREAADLFDQAETEFWEIFDEEQLTTRSNARQ